MDVFGLDLQGLFFRPLDPRCNLPLPLTLSGITKHGRDWRAYLEKDTKILNL
jgi:hypothetical protein